MGWFTKLHYGYAYHYKETTLHIEPIWHMAAFPSLAAIGQCIFPPFDFRFFHMPRKRIQFDFRFFPHAEKTNTVRFSFFPHAEKTNTVRFSFFPHAEKTNTVRFSFFPHAKKTNLHVRFLLFSHLSKKISLDLRF